MWETGHEDDSQQALLQLAPGAARSAEKSGTIADANGRDWRLTAGAGQA